MYVIPVMSGNIQDHLRTQLNSLHAVGQISTSRGQEVLCTSGSRNTRVEASSLANAFVDTDQLARSLKLGAVRQVIISQSPSYPGQYRDGHDGHVPRRADSVVQTKTQSGYHPNGDSLLTTTVAPSLENAMIGDSIIRDSAQRALRR